jgi:hypothetical protein
MGHWTPPERVKGHVYYITSPFRVKVFNHFWGDAVKRWTTRITSNALYVAPAILIGYGIVSYANRTVEHNKKHHYY